MSDTDRDLDAAVAKFFDSLPRRIDFAAPANFPQAYSYKQIVYGIPLSQVWFNTRYTMQAKIDAESGKELDREIHKRQLMIDAMHDCRRLITFKCYPEAARSGNYGWLTILVLGRPWVKPTPEQVKAIRMMLMRDHMVVDNPVWLPIVF